MTNKERIKLVFSKNGFYYAMYYGLKFLHIDRVFGDRLYVSLQYHCYTGRKLELKNPTRFNEKLCWLKLYDHNPQYSLYVDKYEVKKFVEQRVGKEYVIPTLAKWDTPENIDISNLPDRFVLKANHSGNNQGVIICKDKASFNINEAIVKLRKAYDSDMYMAGREWPYKNVKRCIIAEKFMEDDVTHELRDYKFFCFDGKVKALFIATDRNKKGEKVKFNYFDEYFNHLGITNSSHAMNITPPNKPLRFEEMKRVAAKLSEGFPFVRVDLYEVNGKVYFGELTLYTGNGTEELSPDEWNYTFGEWIDLNIVKKGNII